MAPAPSHVPRGRSAVPRTTSALRTNGYESGEAAGGRGRHRSGSRGRNGKKKKTPKKKAKRNKTHRAYGLPNANQIFLTMVVVALLFVELLRPNWLIFNQSNATAGLSGIRIDNANDTTSRVAWSDFCDPQRFDYEIHLDPTAIPPLSQPFQRKDAIRVCNNNTPEIVRVLTATAIAFSMLSVTISLYFHLGSPSQRQVVFMGVVPGCSLLATAVLGTAALAVWQQNLGAYDNGDCFSVCVASTVIAYVISISMAIRWRWPGIFAVDNEQQAFEARRNWRRNPPQHTVESEDGDDHLPPSPRGAATFHAVV